MARFEYKSDRCGNGCSTVYRAKGQNRSAPRGKAALGRVCFRDDAPTRDTRWEATVADRVGYGPTKDVAVSAATAGRVADPAPDLITLAAVTAYTGIPRRTLNDWVRDGYLKCRSLTRTHLVTCRDVRAAAGRVFGGRHVTRSQQCPCGPNEGA